MGKLKFFNACRILLNIDRHELEAAGVIEPGAVGGTCWTRFNRDPLVFMAKLSDERADRLWALIEARQPARYRETVQAEAE